MKMSSRMKRTVSSDVSQWRFLLGRWMFLIWLVFVWVALWESISLGVLISGVIVATGLVLLFPSPSPRPIRSVRPLAAARFLGYFAYRLVLANLVVAWEVITPQNRINQGVVEVPIKGASDALVTLLANAISLTPGTLTVEARRDPPLLYIHVLHLRSVEEVRRDVERLEKLAIAAFGDRSMKEVGLRNRPSIEPEKTP